MKNPKVKFDVKRIARLYKSGKNVSQIAQALGYPKGHGQNRTRVALTGGPAFRVLCEGRGFQTSSLRRMVGYIPSRSRLRAVQHDSISTPTSSPVR